MSHAVQFSDLSDRVLETCLIVDDDSFDRSLLRQAVQRQRPDMQTFEFDKLSEARDYLKTAHADLILLDNRLPDGRGADLAVELRANPRLVDTPIIVVTGDDVSTLDHGVTALSKEELSATNLGELVAEFLKARRIERSTNEGRLVEAFGETMQESMAPALSRAIRTLRTARAQVTRSAPFGAIHALEEVEDILLAMSSVLSEKRRKPDA